MSTCSDQFRSPMPMAPRAFEYPTAFSPSNPSNARALEVMGTTEMEVEEPSAPAITEHDLATAYEKGRREGLAEAEHRFSQQLAQVIASERARVSKMIDEFHQNSSEYYAKVEDQVVHLSLGIAAKILHREAQVDPLLVAALVKLATENLKQGSHVQVNIHPSEFKSWSSYFEVNGSGRIKIELVEDAALSPGDCVVHSEVGIAALGIAAQLKEIERGLFDLLAQRPKNE